MFRISVIIPTHNRSTSLKKTLLSLINQTYTKENYEIIVVNDGGSNETETMIQELNRKTNSEINYFWQKNQGPAAARNLGIKHANADIIAFTDDDCIVNSDWIENILKSYEEHTDAMIIGGETLPPKGSIVAKVSQGLTKNAYFDYVDGKKQAIFFPTCNVSFKKKVFETAGLFDTDFPLAAGEDLEFCWRCFKKGMKLYYEPKIRVTHYCASTLWQYARQSFNYGRGNYLTKLKQPDHPELRMLETGSNLKFFFYCILEILEAPRFASLFTKRIKGGIKIYGVMNIIFVFFILLVHRFSYLAGNIKERIKEKRKHT